MRARLPAHRKPSVMAEPEHAGDMKLIISAMTGWA